MGAVRGIVKETRKVIVMANLTELVRGVEMECLTVILTEMTRAIQSGSRMELLRGMLRALLKVDRTVTPKDS